MLAVDPQPTSWSVAYSSATNACGIWGISKKGVVEGCAREAGEECRGRVCLVSEEGEEEEKLQGWWCRGHYCYQTHRRSQWQALHHSDDCGNLDLHARDRPWRTRMGSQTSSSHRVAVLNAAARSLASCLVSGHANHESAHTLPAFKPHQKAGQGPSSLFLSSSTSHIG